MHVLSQHLASLVKWVLLSDCSGCSDSSGELAELLQPAVDMHLHSSE